MDREADILKNRVEIAALGRRRIETEEGIGGQQDEQREGDRNQACTANTLAFSVSGRLRPKTATSALNSVRINSQSSIDPS